MSARERKEAKRTEKKNKKPKTTKEMNERITFWTAADVKLCRRSLHS